MGATLPGLAELLRRGPFLLLLDAVNEIPHAGDGSRVRAGWDDALALLGPEPLITGTLSTVPLIF